MNRREFIANAGALTLAPYVTWCEKWQRHDPELKFRDLCAMIDEAMKEEWARGRWALRNPRIDYERAGRRMSIEFNVIRSDRNYNHGIMITDYDFSRR